MRVCFSEIGNIISGLEAACVRVCVSEPNMENVVCKRAKHLVKKTPPVYGCCLGRYTVVSLMHTAYLPHTHARTHTISVSIGSFGSGE